MKRIFVGILLGAIVVLSAGIAGGAAGRAGSGLSIGLAGHLLGPSEQMSPLTTAVEPSAASLVDSRASLHLVSATGELDDCPTVEDSLAQIAIITQGAEIADIVAALSQVQSSPASAGEEEGQLAQRLREGLNLSASPPCATAGQAVDEALRLAQLAQETVETAALNPENPESRFSDDRSGIATGASVSGYN